MILTTRPSCPSKVFHFGRISRQHRLTKNKSACAVLPESMALSASPQTLGNQRIGSPPKPAPGNAPFTSSKVIPKIHQDQRLETRSLDSLFVGLPPQTVQWHSRALLAASTVSAIANCLTDVAMPSIDFKTMEQMLASRKLHDLNSRVLKALAQLEVAGACPHEDKQKLLAAQSVLQDKQFQLSNVLNGWKGKTDSDVDVFMEETDAYLRVADYILRSL
eukprot:jgi/Botrbrau1/1051/Bobra.0076s0018.1